MIEGLYDGIRWPDYGIKGVGGNATIYNNIIRNSGGDGIRYIGSDVRIVRNLVHNVNRNAWDEEVLGDGAAIVLRDGSVANAYLAGNLLEPARDFTGPTNRHWHHSLVVMGEWSSPGENVVAERNTIVAPPENLSQGSAVHWAPPQDNVFRFNVLDSTLRGTRPGKPPVSVSVEQVEQVEPHGLRGNHLIRYSALHPFVSPEDLEAAVEERNVIYDSWPAYETDAAKDQAIGSDIDADDFWAPVCRAP